MRAYKRMAKFSILIAIISLLIAIFLNFCFVIDKMGFWTNVCLGVFGSATLTILTSVVSYFHTQKCLSPAKKYKLYKSSINKSIHFVQRSLSSSTRGQRVTA